ncbi:hypothetical protein A8C56_14190 [Niabella ginsenosidivorans]|uniref:Uncharacterized protein n=2 Tax=Niabella ginsenosidivorans TaxID=1176587 RepID=A0A1A9I3S3_9BACT|nr:hypothetical protein A8C56_14190 [Niabella ginsenosidivorans]
MVLSGCKGCSFSKGFSKDLNTKLSVTYNGFTAERFALVDANMQPLKDNRVQGNSSFSLVAYNIANYTLADNKAYPACEMTLNDDAGKTLLHAPDIFAEKAPDGVSAENGKYVTVTATYTIPAALKGKTLHAIVRVTDRKNPGNVILMKDDVIVQ